MRASLTVLAAAVVLTALPVATQAQTRTTTRGAFGGAVTSDMTFGAVRGSVPQDATVGAIRGSVPTGGIVGAVRDAPSAAVGGFRAESPSAASPGLFLPTTNVWFRGAMSPGSVGAFATPAPGDTVLGRPGAQEMEGRLQTEATFRLWDGNYRQAETMLNSSVGRREEIVGGTVRPEVAGALDSNATYLRGWNRDAAAIDMEARAKDIRKKLEPPPAAKRPERAERF